MFNAYATNTHAGLLMPVGEPLCLRAHPAEPIDASRRSPMLTGTCWPIDASRRTHAALSYF
jgi:hypothetical protein